MKNKETIKRKVFTGVILSTILWCATSQAAPPTNDEITVTCQGEGLTVTAVSLEPYAGFASKGEEALVSVSDGDKKLFEVAGEVTKLSTRVGIHYHYKLALNDVLFSMNEYTGYETFPPNCSEHSRVTCDFKFSYTYEANLTFNGESHDLECEIQK